MVAYIFGAGQCHHVTMMQVCGCSRKCAKIFRNGRHTVGLSLANLFQALQKRGSFVAVQRQNSVSQAGLLFVLVGIVSRPPFDLTFGVRGWDSCGPVEIFDFPKSLLLSGTLHTLTRTDQISPNFSFRYPLSDSVQSLEVWACGRSPTHTGRICTHTCADVHETNERPVRPSSSS